MKDPGNLFDDMLDVWDDEYSHEHECAVTAASKLKYNGGNCVLLCGIEENCSIIVACGVDPHNWRDSV